MNSAQFRIIELFSKGWNIELTINQIAKRIKKSYAYTNKYTHQLIDLGILKKKQVGSALLCSLNFAHPKTQAALVFITLSKQHSDQDLPVHVVCYRIKNKRYVVGKKQKYKAHYLSYEQFIERLPAMDFAHLNILQGAEQFWKSVAKVKL